jgi:hypothetical protein
MMILGMSLMTVGFWLIPFAESLPADWQAGWFIASWSLVSLSAPLFMVNGPPFLMGVTGAAERDHVFAMQAGLMPLAGFIGSLVAGFLPGIFSRILTIPEDHPAPYRYPLFFIGGLFFIGILVIRTTNEVRLKEEQASVSKAGPLPLVLISLMGGVMLLRMTGEWAPSIFFNVYMDTELHASTILIGSLVAVSRLLAGGTALMTPLLVKRWSKERIIGGGTLGIALSLVPLALLPHLGAAGIGFIGAITLTFMVNAAFFVYGQELVTPSWQAIMSGAIWVGMGIGGSSILIGGGRIITAFGYRSLFLTAAGLTAAGGLLFLGYFRVPRGEFTRSSEQQTDD